MEVFRWNSGKVLKLNFFKKKFNLLQIFSAHMECNFGNSAKIILQETQKILAQCPEVRKVLFLQNFVP